MKMIISEKNQMFINHNFDHQCIYTKIKNFSCVYSIVPQFTFIVQRLAVKANYEI